MLCVHLGGIGGSLLDSGKSSGCGAVRESMQHRTAASEWEVKTHGTLTLHTGFALTHQRLWPGDKQNSSETLINNNNKKGW